MRVRRRIAILNRSKKVDDSYVDQVVEALQIELDGTFAKAWGTGAKLSTVDSGKDTGWEKKWNVVIVDNMEVANALGYHDLTPDGLPVGYVGVDVIDASMASMSVTISHEVFEMLGDPECNQTVDDGRGRLCWYENCDAVEADVLAIESMGMLISDYVYPTWFVPTLRGRDLKFDRQGVTTHPFDLVSGGYQGYTTQWPPNWEQEYARDTDRSRKMEARPNKLSRRYRRMIPRHQWQRSEA